MVYFVNVRTMSWYYCDWSTRELVSPCPAAVMAHVTINQYLQEVRPAFCASTPCDRQEGGGLLNYTILLRWCFSAAGVRGHRQPRGLLLRRAALVQAPTRRQPPAPGEAPPTHVDIQVVARIQLHHSVCVCVCVRVWCAPVTDGVGNIAEHQRLSLWHPAVGKNPSNSADQDEKRCREIVLHLCCLDCADETQWKHSMALLESLCDKYSV